MVHRGNLVIRYRLVRRQISRGAAAYFYLLLYSEYTYVPSC